MASAYDKASLVMLPHAYKDDKLYSVKPEDRSGDFTFSRDGSGASPATRVNASGYIEKGRENLLSYSNTFNTGWSPVNGTFVQGVADPFGGNDAWSWTATNTDPYLYNPTAWSGAVTLSIWAKGVGSSIGKDFEFRMGGYVQSFTLTSDWQRFELFANGSASNIGFEVGNPAVAGDVVHIYGAQLEYGLVATDYIETTTTAVSAGLLGDMPRLDYSGGATCPSLLLEPSRINGNAHSEYFAGAGFGIVAATQTPNAATSPEGVTNATSFVGAASTAEHIIYTTGSTTYNGATTVSIFAKANGYDYFVLGAGAQSANKTVLFNIANGTKVGNFTGWSSYSAPIDSDIEDYGNGWYRLWVTFDATSGVNTNMFFGSMPTDTIASGANVSTQNGTDGSFIYGAMIESGSYPTSYIPTYGSAASRAADSSYKTSATDLIGQTEGSFFIEVNTSVLGDIYGGNNRRFFTLSDGTTNNRIVLAQNRNTDAINLAVITSATLIADISTGSNQSGIKKIGVAYANNDFVMYLNGVQIGTDTSGGVPPCSRIGLGVYETGTGGYNAACPIKQALVFKTRLTNAELAALTA